MSDEYLPKNTTKQQRTEIDYHPITEVNNDIIKRGCLELGLPLYVTEGANHSLETGDVDADISELAKIMYICEEYRM